MAEEFSFHDPRAARRRGTGSWSIFFAILVAVLLGAVAALWGGHELGLVELDRKAVGLSGAEIPPSPSPSTPTSAEGIESAQTALAVRIGELEQRMARLNVQAETASGSAARAEGLLIAAAARRSIERGKPLGYLENELKARFGDAQPNAVQTLIEISAAPVTLDALLEGLSGLSPTLVAPPANASLVDRIGSELSSLFVIRRASAPSPAPEKRLERARMFLETGRPEAAIGEVERMPGHDAARDWVALAQRYVRAQRALDLIETAAILEPDQPAPTGPVARPLPAPIPGSGA